MINDRFLQEIEYDLKMRMKAAKRKPVNNAKTQVRSFNTSTRPERILDHNDPYKVEWTDPAVEGEFIIGQKVPFVSTFPSNPSFTMELLLVVSIDANNRDILSLWL